MLHASAAQALWNTRRQFGKWFFVRNLLQVDLFSGVVAASISDGLGDAPLIIIDHGGYRFYIRNGDPGLMPSIREILPRAHTFTLESNCWGIDNLGCTAPQEEQITVARFICHLSILLGTPELAMVV